MKRQWPRLQRRGRSSCLRAGRGGLEGPGKPRARPWTLTDPTPPPPTNMCNTLIVCDHTHLQKKVPVETQTPRAGQDLFFPTPWYPCTLAHTPSHLCSHTHMPLHLCLLTHTVITKIHSCPFSRICDHEACGHTHSHSVAPHTPLSPRELSLSPCC